MIPSELLFVIHAKNHKSALSQAKADQALAKSRNRPYIIDRVVLLETKYQNNHTPGKKRWAVYGHQKVI